MRIPAAYVLLPLLLLAAPSLGQTVVVDVDPAFPSGGSGAPLVFSGGGVAEVVLDTTDPGPAPLSLVADNGLKTPAPTLTFTGFTQAPSLDGGFSYKPPDTHHAVDTGMGAAGRVVHVTNSGVRIFNKTGASIAGPLDLDAFLTGLGATGLSAIGAANKGFDPKVIFDQHSGRFFIVILDDRTAGVRSNVHICTSKTATPGTLTAADWTVETASALTTFVGGDSWFDYPGIGADATRLVVTGNMFTAAGAFTGTKVRVFLKSSLTDNGVPAGATFNDIDVDVTVTSGIGTAQPAHVFGTTLNGDFYLINRFGSTAYRQWQITGAGGAASLVAGSPTMHAWTAGALLAAGAPQITDGMNDNPTISTLSARIQNAVYRNDVGNTDSIWLALAADSDGDLQTEVVWFEIDPNTANSAVAGTLTVPTINQSGSIDGSTGADWTFMPSIAVNGSGNVVIGYSESNGAKAVDQRAAGRFGSDPAGTFQAPVVVATGAGEYDDFSDTDPERWGDYSGTVVDPDDDVTFWVSNEITETASTAAGDDGRWGTRIARLGAVPTVTSIAPTSGPTAGGTPVTIMGTNFVSGMTVALNGAAATSVVVVNPLTITATTGARAAGTVAVAVTNPAMVTGTLPGGFTYIAPAVFTDDPLEAGTTVIKEVHFRELRERIDVQLVRFGELAQMYTNAPIIVGATIKAVDLLEMYAAVNDALGASPLSLIAVPTITPGTTIALASHITALRVAVLALEALP